MGTLAPYWGDTLTQVQRNVWTLYGDNVPWLNPLGQTIFLTGQQHFNRINTVHLQIGEAIIADAPVIYNLGTFTTPTFSLATAAPLCEVSYDNTDAWANGAGGFLVVYCGKSISIGRKFYRGPWRYAGHVTGDAVPPVSPFSQHPGWNWGAGNNTWVQLRVIQTDGRMSLPVILGPRQVGP